MQTISTQFATVMAATLLIPSFIFLACGVNHRDMPFWWAAAIGNFLIFFGANLAAAPNLLPKLAVIFLGNALVSSGYFWCLRSVRMAKDDWKFYRADVGIIGAYFVGLILVIGLHNTYPARVALFSSFLAVISMTTLLVPLRCSAPFSRLGDAALLVFAVGNSTVAVFRGATALMSRDERFLSLEFWDQIFFYWSVAAVLCFAVGLFLNGTAMISKQTRQSLEKERALKDAVNEALESQRNLQKLVLHEIKRPINSMATAIHLSNKSRQGMNLDEVDRIHQLICVTSDYLHGIGEYEDIHTLFNSPTLIVAELSSLVVDLRNKWQVTVHVPDEAALMKIPVDLLLFDIAVGNLIENARKFGATPNAVQININTEKDFVIFDVIDDGPGIPPDEAEKVFQQFYKIDITQTSPVKGCGLGLYVVQRVAKAHGGSCQVLAQRPSTIRLSFPKAIPPGIEHE